MRYSKYPSYQDSGVEWLGDIPEHWENNTLRRDLIEHKQGFYSTEPYNDYGVKLLRITDIKNSGQVDFSKCPRVTMYQEDKHFLLRNGDFVFARTGGAGSFGYIKNLTEDILFASYLIRFRFNNNINSTFLRYYFMSFSFINSINSNIHGGVNKNIHAEDIKDSYIAKPSLKEQQAIANYLDIATTKIDTLIEKQTQLIVLLKEKRQAVISTAVTCGLDSTVATKDSGVEYLGKIPEDWDVKRLASIGRFSKGGGFSKKDLVDTGVAAILYGDIYTRYDIQIKSISRFISDDVAKNVVKIRKGDLLFTGSGETVEDIGKCVTYLDEEVICAGGDVIIFRQISEDSLFLSYALGTEGSILQKTLSAKGQIIVHIYASSLRNIILTFPPLAEQQAIARYLDDKTSKIDTLITKSTKAIDLLKEKRTALISAVVTGKIDIREIA